MEGLNNENTGGVTGEGNNTGDTGTAGMAQDWGFLPDGLDSLKEGHESPEKFWANVSSLHGMAKEKAIMTGTKPESLVTPEEKAAFWKSMGLPEKPDGYKLPENVAFEGVSEDVQKQVNFALGTDRAEIMNAFHAAGLTDAQANALYTQLGTVMARNLEGATAPDAEKIIAGLWPENTEANLAIAKRGAVAMGADFGSRLDEKGLSFDPDVLALCHALGRATGEDTVRNAAGGGASGLPTGEAAKEEMHRLISSEAYHKNDAATMRRINQLAEQVSRK